MNSIIEAQQELEYCRLQEYCTLYHNGLNNAVSSFIDRAFKKEVKKIGQSTISVLPLNYNKEDADRGWKILTGQTKVV